MMKQVNIDQILQGHHKVTDISFFNTSATIRLYGAYKFEV